MTESATVPALTLLKKTFLKARGALPDQPQTGSTQATSSRPTVSRQRPGSTRSKALPTNSRRSPSTTSAVKKSTPQKVPGSIPGPTQSSLSVSKSTQARPIKSWPPTIRMPPGPAYRPPLSGHITGMLV
jgi:hypothetical protein